MGVSPVTNAKRNAALLTQSLEIDRLTLVTLLSAAEVILEDCLEEGNLIELRDAVTKAKIMLGLSDEDEDEEVTK